MEITLDATNFHANSRFNTEPTVHFVSEAGVAVGGADTAVPTPVPGCFNPVGNPDCFISHAFVWRGDGLHDLGTLPGSYFSFAYAINARGQIVGVSENNQNVDSPEFPAGFKNCELDH